MLLLKYNDAFKGIYMWFLSFLVRFQVNIPVPDVLIVKMNITTHRSISKVADSTIEITSLPYRANYRGFTRVQE